MPEAPILILLAPFAASPGTADMARGPDGDSIILGLSLIQRAALAARRAGYGQVFLLGAKGPAASGAAGIADWRDLTAVLPLSLTEPIIIAPAAILAETEWLERLASRRIEPANWGRIPDRIIVLAAASAVRAVDELDSGGAAQNLAAVEGRLARLFGPPASLSADIDPMVVATPSEIPAAERRLLKSLVKDTDGFMARHVERPISLQISRRLAGTAITPNQMSLISVAVGICGGPFFLSSRPLMQTIGALLFLAHSILDGCDGELARLKFQQSRWGGVLDFWGDNVVHTIIFGCMSIGWSLAAGALWPLWLGAGAVLGTLGSAGFVYWRLMRPKGGDETLFTSVSDAPERPLTRLLDSASRRDFIYLVILLALFGRSNWFLVMAGIGAPIYFFLVLFAARARPPWVEAGRGSRQA
jgi:1L-myo-inositol 1-phosphate cytidylyltransferase / CDP-L-myo-inositol myo-inositolphosphotransferase